MKQSNDIVKMIKDFTKLADSPDGNVYAAYRLGCIYMDKEDPEHYDAEKAIGYLEKKQRIVRMEMSMQRTVWAASIWIKRIRNTMMQRKRSDI